MIIIPCPELTSWSMLLHARSCLVSWSLSQGIIKFRWRRVTPYHYTVMPFGLINARATYQRMVNKLFDEMIDETMQVYVDDMLVKSIKGVDHLEDLTKTFE